MGPSSNRRRPNAAVQWLEKHRGIVGAIVGILLALIIANAIFGAVGFWAVLIIMIVIGLSKVPGIGLVIQPFVPWVVGGAVILLVGMGAWKIWGPKGMPNVNVAGMPVTIGSPQGGPTAEQACSLTTDPTTQAYIDCVSQTLQRQQAQAIQAAQVQQCQSTMPWWNPRRHVDSWCNPQPAEQLAPPAEVQPTPQPGDPAQPPVVQPTQPAVQPEQPQSTPTPMIPLLPGGGDS